MSGVASHGTFASGRGGWRTGARRGPSDLASSCAIDPGVGRGPVADAQGDGHRRLVLSWSIEPLAAGRVAPKVFSCAPGEEPGFEPGFEIALEIDSAGVRSAAWRWTGLARSSSSVDGTDAVAGPLTDPWTPFACDGASMVRDEDRGLVHARVPGLVEITAFVDGGSLAVLFARSALLEDVLAEGGVAGGRCEFVGLEERSRADSAA